MLDPTASLADLYLRSHHSMPSQDEISLFLEWLNREWLKIPAAIAFTPMSVTLETAKRIYINTGKLVVSTAFNNHPCLSYCDNVKFRALHDWHHIISGADDTLKGEIMTYNVAKSTAPQRIWWILFSDIILQAAACLHTGRFHEQKLVRV